MTLQTTSSERPNLTHFTKNDPYGPRFAQFSEVALPNSCLRGR